MPSQPGGAAGRLLRKFFLNPLDAVRSAVLPELIDGCEDVVVFGWGSAVDVVHCADSFPFTGAVFLGRVAA